MFTAKVATPILRIFDEAKAKEFYLDFLGFTLNFEHRFEENFPLYAGISFSECDIHLSEHHGDASPGAHIRIQVNELGKYRKTLSLKQYKYAKPEKVTDTPWGTTEVTLTDPFGNRLTFYEETAEQS